MRIQKYHTELIDGQEMTKFVPKIDHAEVQSCVIRLYGNFYPTWRALSELNVTCGQDRVVPDVTVVGLDAKYDDGDLVSNPVFAVEIMSPGQTLGNIFDRSDRLVEVRHIARYCALAGAPPGMGLYTGRRC